MIVNNEQVPNATDNVAEIHLIPISKNISKTGTTVTYALNNTEITSGNYINTSEVTNSEDFGVTAQYQQQPSSMTLNQMAFEHMIHPAIELSETSSDLVVSACLGNERIDDVSLSVVDDSLTLSGVVTNMNGSQRFNRVVALPTLVKADLVDARIESGIVEIRLPKVEKLAENLIDSNNMMK
ncbi:Hsp20/alpha crystallin family protein [Clostridium ganghwense]|uniref:Hsp20/alpha crystallin family protein n=1 Tax=Clostridium ganghwense TaxID=312089 RepID=A0ABT4CSC4_9CLOT|nr:Hsp20/alpha crystallin family protein [Clostridium ganghwense]MCY6371823.1 Hsp20/alpha crystallin family protein [Clostridium ganghwense]